MVERGYCKKRSFGGAATMSGVCAKISARSHDARCLNKNPSGIKLLIDEYNTQLRRKTRGELVRRLENPKSRGARDRNWFLCRARLRILRVTPTFYWRVPKEMCQSRRISRIGQLRSAQTIGELSLSCVCVERRSRGARGVRLIGDRIYDDYAIGGRGKACLGASDCEKKLLALLTIWKASGRI